jgi:hypothetical protein
VSTDGTKAEDADAPARTNHVGHRSNASTRNQGGGVLSFAR